MAVCYLLIAVAYVCVVLVNGITEENFSGQYKKNVNLHVINPHRCGLHPGMQVSRSDIHVANIR